MHKIGLKLYSTNKNYAAPAKELYQAGCYDFIEILPVPGSYESSVYIWSQLSIPYVVHIPHVSFGLNLGRADMRDHNFSLVQESIRFANDLKAQFLVCHPGTESDIEESARQFKAIADPRMLVENKPYCTTDGKAKCIGGSYEDIQYVLNNAGVGFCLDVSHCIAYAVNIGKPWLDYLRSLTTLRPRMYHVSDGVIASGRDTHDHIGAGDFEWEKIVPLIPCGSMVTLETAKNSQDSLDDFVEDVIAYRALLAKHLPKVQWKNQFLPLAKPSFEDSKAVFSLSNDPSVRKWSINQNPISWDEHAAWFSNKLNDPNCEFYILKSSDGDLLAQVRYELNQESCTASVSVNPAYRGLGLATQLLRETSPKVLLGRSFLKQITALITEGNEASLAAFRKAGYVYSCTLDLEGRPFKKYIYQRDPLCVSQT